MRPGDPFGDYSQRAIMLTLIFEPVLANDDGVGAPAPLTDQCCPGFRSDTGIERRALLKFSGQPLQAAPQCPARPAGSTLLQLMNEGSDQQIATEPARRARGMQLAPGNPQFGCRVIEQFGNLTVDLGEVCTTRSAGPVADWTGSRRRSPARRCGRRDRVPLWPKPA